MSTSISIDRAGQHWFAAATGDWNPLHMDPADVASTPFENNLVHGIHALIAALDAASHAFNLAGRIARLNVTFAKPVFPGDCLTLSLVRRTDDGLRLALLHQEEAVVRLTVTLGDANPGPAPQFASADTLIQAAPDTPDLAAATPVVAPLPLARAQAAIITRYPGAAALFAPGGLESLALTSTAVGMRWPGRHSLFSSIDARFPGTPGGPVDRLELAAEPVDPRLGMTRLTAANAFLHAAIDAFRLPPPVDQPGLAELRPHVAAHRFAGQRALVIGATDGLGALAARLLACGGARLTLSYRSKPAAAHALAAEIRAAGGAASAVALDVGDPASLDALDWQGYDSVLLFASPKIFLRKTRFWDQARFAGFAEAYLAPLADIAGRLHQKGSKANKHILYPSTVAIDEASVEIVEYAAAKLAGELLADAIARRYPDVAVVVARLPRLATQQTNQVIAAAAADPVTTLLPLLDRLQPGG